MSVFCNKDEEWKPKFLNTLNQSSDVDEVFEHKLVENGKMNFQDLLIIFEDRYKSVEYGAQIHNMDPSQSMDQ